MQLLQVSDRLYWTGTVNAGVRWALAAGTEFIFTVNDDALMPAGHIAALVAIATKHQLQILGNRIDYLDPPGQVWSLGTYTHWGTSEFLALAYNRSALTSVPAEILSTEIRPVDALPGNGVLIQRQVFEAVGLYNQRWLPHYHADSELIMRAQRRGFQPYIAPMVALLNDFQESQKQVSQLHSSRWQKGWARFGDRKSHLYVPAVAYTLLKYCPPQQLLATLGALGQRLQGSPYIN